MKLKLSLPLDRNTSIPYSGFYICTVSFSERYWHVGGSLFQVTDLVASRVKEVQDDKLSVTSSLCTWTDPKGAVSAPTVMHELSITKT